MKKFTALVLALSLVLSLTGCSAGKKAYADIDLMKGVRPQWFSTEKVDISGENAVAPTDFAVRLFQSALDGEENTMISPISLLYALAMTANGAGGNTLAQMEAVFGMPISELNSYLKSYADALPESKQYKLSIANSIWLTDDARFSVVPEFLQTNANYYGADIYQAPFDEATCRNINDWVKDNTDGMIPEILDGMQEEAVIYLINAIAFDAEWQEIYREDQIRERIFTTESKVEKEVELMYSMEQLYLEDENATGFIKDYADSQYAFVALLPREGMSVRDYAATLSGENLASLLNDAQETKVNTAIPKFESEYSADMCEILISMGMEDAFSASAADFSGLGGSSSGSIYISQVLHKTFITVDEKGTKAGAAAAAVGVDGGNPKREETKAVILDRPFVYMIIDREANLPLFMGTVMDVG